MATILVVDDEMASRSLISEILADQGHKVTLAEDAAQARAYRNRIRPDLVLLDIWMPEVDGITLLKEWSSNEQLTMPVIMLSAHGSIDTAVNATKLGAVAFLEKPITLQKLLRSVAQNLAQWASRVATASAMQRGTRATVEIGMTGGVMAPTVTVRLGPEAFETFDLDRPLREARDDFEKSYFEFHLTQENGSMTRVAEKTGIERTHLYRKLKQLGLDSWRTQHRHSAVSAEKPIALVRSSPFRGAESPRREPGPTNDDSMSHL